MRWNVAVTWAFTTFVVHTALAQPNIPMEIPEDTLPEVKSNIEKLYSKDALTRGKAANELSKLEERALPALPFLVDILDEKTPLQWRGIGFVATSTGKLAGQALGNMGKKAEIVLISLLEDENPTVRRNAVFGLARRGDGILEDVRGLIGDPDSGVRHAVVSTLASAKKEQYRELLAERLMKDPDATVREKAAWGVSPPYFKAPFKDPFVTSLRHALADEYPRVRSNASGAALLEQA